MLLTYFDIFLKVQWSSQAKGSVREKTIVLTRGVLSNGGGLIEFHLIHRFGFRDSIAGASGQIKRPHARCAPETKYPCSSAQQIEGCVKNGLTYNEPKNGSKKIRNKMEYFMTKRQPAECPATIAATRPITTANYYQK